MNRVLGSPVSGSVSEASCVCSKMIELWMTARRLLADAIEQATMIVAIEAGRRVVDGKRADDAVAKDQRAHQRRLQTRLRRRNRPPRGRRSAAR